MKRIIYVLLTAGLIGLSVFFYTCYKDYYREYNVVKSGLENIEGVDIIQINGNPDITLEDIYATIVINKKDTLSLYSLGDSSFTRTNGISLYSFNNWGLRIKRCTPRDSSESYFLHLGNYSDLEEIKSLKLKNVQDIVKNVDEIRATINNLAIYPKVDTTTVDGNSLLIQKYDIHKIPNSRKLDPLFVDNSWSHIFHLFCCMEIDILYPLIVPASYCDSGAWDLPHHKFPNKTYVLTWVYFRAEGSMSYITRKEYEELNDKLVNWQQQTFENLRALSDVKGLFYTDYRTDPSTGKLSYIAFVNDDGIGSSRILLSHELSKSFPDGYTICMPDRYCGIVVAASISRSEKDLLKTTIDRMYGCSGTAMSKSLFDPADFTLPAEWLAPIEAELSAWIIERVQSYAE